MALSCYSKWEELETHLNSDMSIFAQPHTEMAPELLGVDSSFGFSESYGAPFMESQELFYSNYCNSTFHPFVSSLPENIYSLVPEVFPAQEYEPYNYLKRQAVYDESFNTEIFPGLCNGYTIPNPGLFQELSPEIVGPFPDFTSNPLVYSSNTVEAPKRPGNGGSLSAQSIAARQRRRKITEKTQELGKLIPGGQKMNTAEMFQAAFKYIKFLQTQLGVLETMASIHQENGDSFGNQEMEPLLGSSLIQEKLYVAEKCLVPMKFVEALGNHHKLQSSTTIDHSSLDIKKLL